MKLVRRPVYEGPYRIGDRVVLNSGGPDMFVYDIDEQERALCNWLEGYRLSSHAFDPRTLSRAKATH
jgi:uncharacterized protein YodC (DUF2158 family)